MKIITFTLIISLFMLNSFAQQTESTEAGEQQSTTRQDELLQKKLLAARTSLFNWMKQNLSLNTSQETQLHDLIVENEDGVLLFSKSRVGGYNSPMDVLSDEERAEVNAHMSKYKQEVANILNEKQMQALMSREPEIREILRRELTN